MCLAVNLHKHLVKVPLPVRICAHLADSFPTNLSGKHRAKSVSPKPNRLMADVDAAFVQKVRHVPKRKRKPHIHHNGQADDLWARLEVAEGAVFYHPVTLIPRPARLNRFCSDRTSLIGMNTLGNISDLPIQMLLVPDKRSFRVRLTYRGDR
jgi:hypothetical protein